MISANNDASRDMLSVAEGDMVQRIGCRKMPWRQWCDLKESRSEFLQNKAKSRRHMKSAMSLPVDQITSEVVFTERSQLAKGRRIRRGIAIGAGWGRRIFYGTKPNHGGTFNSAVSLPVDQMTSEVVFLRNEANPQRRSEFGRRVASGAE